MKHHRAKISILLLSVLVIISLTACQSANDQTSATDNTPLPQETPIPDSESYFSSKKTPSIYQDKTVINDNSRLDLAYRPVLEEVIPHATAIVQATVDNIEYTSIGANAWTVIDAAVQTCCPATVGQVKHYDLRIWRVYFYERCCRGGT